jgi:Lon protease-like protein
MDKIPLFPLELVLFPGERLHLHIFEPRYKQLIQDCREEGIHFGIPLYHQKTLYPVGCEAVLQRVFKTYEDGKMDIQVKGARLFRIQDTLPAMPGKLYAGAEVEWLPEPDAESVTPSVIAALLEKIQVLYRFSGISKELNTDPTQFLLADVVHYLGLSLQQEYELRAILQVEDQIQFLMTHLDVMVPAMEAAKRMQEKVAMNGHFKELDSPFLF